VEDALPAIAYLALKYHDNPAQGLIANTNLGGDNAGRGAVLGALLGAGNGIRALPESWIKGLRHPPPNLIRQTRKEIPMSKENTEELYVKVKDMAGNDFICPLNELRDPKSISDAELDKCFEGDVIGRYAGQMNIVNR
jgi:hypothetical protein